MPVQLIPLAILAAITSPTTIAAVLVILNRPGPVPLLTGYVSSFATSVLVGTAIVLGLAATSLFASRNGPAIPSVDLGIGVLILLGAGLAVFRAVGRAQAESG